MIDLQIAVCIDIETLPNCFTLNVQGLFSNLDMTFEISDQGRDDSAALQEWFEYWRATQTPMVGFNSISFDYPVLHFMWKYPEFCEPREICNKAQEIIRSSYGGNRWAHQVWESDRLCPQIDLFKIHHFDNAAKSTSLKALQFAMRSESVLECPLPFDVPVTRADIDRDLIPYNKHDVSETKQFAHFSMDAIKFRVELSETLKGDVLNFNDSKIGSKFLEQRLGDDLCYTWESGTKQPRQTWRESIALSDIIFPYIEFEHPEFQRILIWMRAQTLSVDELTESKIVTKGVFKGVSAAVGGMDYHFGTGGIHGSVATSRWVANEEWGIYDIDVAGYYVAIPIQNRLYPEHLGERFIEEYAKLPAERAKHKKGTAQNGIFKLAGNGTYGNSNNAYSCFLDARFTMAITINGQLMLCMLAEWLQMVEGLQVLQINTDGITYWCPRTKKEHAEIVQRIWERRTRLTLESVEYSKLFIRDCNNYIAETRDGKLKQKGAYWFPRNFPADISGSSPPAWHKDYSAQIVTMAAVEHMVTGCDIAQFVQGHGDSFDFMCRAKVDRASQLWIGDQQQQRITRYYLARDGAPMRKVSPPTGEPGTFKRRSGITDHVWAQRTAEWDERFHTKNRSVYETREMAIEAGHRVAQCNVASDFDWDRVNYDWYIEQARKLVIA